MTDPTSPIKYYGETTGTASRIPVQTLNQDDFLKLLIAQMVSQDPLNPKSDMEMIPQMVQFSTLEQSKAMQADIASLRAEQEVLRANSLLGRTVEIQDGPQTKVTGKVSAVQMEEGMPQLVVNGKRYYLSQVLKITIPSAY
jgi:flagellar basal-body rod modification protein FlgD